MSISSDHRPWDVPAEPWAMKQHWHELMFAHWRVVADVLRQRIPPPLQLDTFDGEAWLGIVPFRMSGVRPRGITSVPWLSNFAELNVRTYVTHGGKPGVFFFSLDAANSAAVAIARRFFFLPYYNARMSCARQTSGEIHYDSRRTHRPAPPAVFRVRYGPVGEIYHSQIDDLDHWFTSRYCLYTVNPRGKLLIGEINHLPWDLQPAEAEFEANTLAADHGLPLLDAPPLLHYVHHLEVNIWRLRAAQ